MMKRKAKAYKDIRTDKAGEEAVYWRVRFHWKGKSFQCSCPTEAQARVRAEEATGRLALLAQGCPLDGVSVKDFVFGAEPSRPKKLPKTAKRLPVSIEEHLHHFADLRRGKKAELTLKTERTHLGHFRRFLAEKKWTRRPVERFTTDDIEQYVAWRRQQKVKKRKIKNVTIKKEIGTLRLVFKSAIKRKIIQHNPTADLEPLKTDPLPEFRTQPEIDAYLKKRGNTLSEEEIEAIRKARVLTSDELQALLSSAKGRAIYEALAIAALTGARRGEIARLTWADVDLEARQITFTSLKQSREETETKRRVPICSQLLPILETLQRRTGGSGYLFPGVEPDTARTTGTMHTSLKELADGTSFGGIGWHTLRHSVASILAMRGADQRVINEILGHTTEAMARRYRHFFPQQKSDAMELLSLPHDELLAGTAA